MLSYVARDTVEDCYKNTIERVNVVAVTCIWKCNSFRVENDEVFALVNYIAMGENFDYFNGIDLAPL